MFRILGALIHFPYFSMMDFAHRCHDIFYYWRNPLFRKADIALMRAYFLRNPYRMCRRFFSSKKCPEPNQNKVQTIYGETFCMTLELLMRRMGMDAHDRVYELGCGRGRSCFYFNAMSGAQVIGIDLNPVFIKKATKIANTLAADNISFIEDSIFNVDLADATIIYFYGIAFNDTATLGLIEKFSQLPAGIRIACVGFSLNDYYDEPLFLEVDEFEAFYLWGKTRIWVCETLGQIEEDNVALSAEFVSEFLDNS